LVENPKGSKKFFKIKKDGVTIMNSRKQPDQEKDVAKRPMQVERSQILSLAPEEALNAIIDSPHSTALIQSFPEEDLYLLINEIGIEDSLPILSHATNEQWTYILDMEIWDGDRMEPTSFTRWLNYLLNADAGRLVSEFLEEHLEGMELYLFNNIQVLIREHDQDPTELGEDCFTFDDQYYFRFIDSPDMSEVDEKYKEERQEVIVQLLQRLAEYDHIRYQKLLLEAATIIPAESEEETYRVRNVRLAEKGFLPFDEAVGIYQPLNPDEISRMEVKQGIGSVELKGDTGISLYPVKMIGKGGLFADALDQIESNDRLHEIQAEFAGLCNRVVSADKLKVRSQEQLESVVNKVLGYINIGLEELILQKAAGVPVHKAVRLITAHPLTSIFRTGYGLALALKWQAEKWQEKSWLEKNRLPLSFWGEEWLGVLGGLLIKKPLYYDNYRTGVLYREFSSLKDITETESLLKEITAFDQLLSLLIPQLELQASSVLITYKNLVLTLWARHYLGLTFTGLTIAQDQFKPFFEDLWSMEGNTRTIRIEMKTSFLNWLSDRTGLTQTEISQKTGATLDRLFTELEDEYGGVSAEMPDPKYLYHFLLKR